MGTIRRRGETRRETPSPTLTPQLRAAMVGAVRSRAHPCAFRREARRRAGENFAVDFGMHGRRRRRNLGGTVRARAIGDTTIGGDLMGALAVIANRPKTAVMCLLDSLWETTGHSGIKAVAAGMCRRSDARGTVTTAVVSMRGAGRSLIGDRAMPFRRVLLVQVAVFGAVWLGSVVAFVSQTSGIAARFAALAAGPYLGVAVRAQLQVLAGSLLVAVVAALLVRPLIPQARLGAQVLRILVLDVALLVLALGPTLSASPGFFDTIERKLRVDLSWLLAVHGLTALSVALVLVTVSSAAWWVRRWRWRIVGGVMGLVWLGASAWPRVPPRETPHPERPNVLVIAADSWRADRLGVHGARRPGLTPNLDAFAATAVDFRQHHVATASTLESWTTVLTGQFPPRHGLRSMYPAREEVAAVEQNQATLPRRLAANGYDTFVSSDWVGNCFDLVDFGFAGRDVAPVQNFEAVVAEATLRSHVLVSLVFSAAPSWLAELVIPQRRALAWAGRPDVLQAQLFERIDESVRAKRPFFGVLFVSPTHLPYNARHPFSSKYADPSYRGPHRFQVEISAHELITTGFSPTLPPETIAHVQALYDGAVSDFDDTAGAVLRELHERGLDDDTIVVVTSDHGEDLYDPGSTLGHGTNFFGGDQSTRVPFLVRAPGLAPRVVEAVTRTVDVAPTLLALLGQTPSESMQGVDLTPLARGLVTDLGLMAFAETCYLFFPKARAMTVLTADERANVVELAGAAESLEVDPTFRHNFVLARAFRQPVIAAKDRMVRDRRFKLIVIPGKQTEIRRLYDLEVDATQQNDLAGRGHEAEARLRALLVDGELPR